MKLLPFFILTVTAPVYYNEDVDFAIKSTVAKLLFTWFQIPTCQMTADSCIEVHKQKLLSEDDELMNAYVRDERTRNFLKMGASANEYALARIQSECDFACGPDKAAVKSCENICSIEYYETYKRSIYKILEERREEERERNRRAANDMISATFHSQQYWNKKWKEEEERKANGGTSSPRPFDYGYYKTMEPHTDTPKCGNKNGHCKARGFGSPCTKNSDCLGTLWCYRGKCDKMSGKGGTCKTHDHCFDPYSCKNGRCA